jgi:mono/diheme cytochrome c family protein
MSTALWAAAWGPVTLGAEERTGAVQNKPTNPVPASDASLKAGRAVYGTWCRSCHGLQGRGDGIAAPEGVKPANLTDAEWKYGGSDAEIFANIRKGIKPFTAMKPQPASLSDTDIWNAVNFIRSLSKTSK